MALINYLIWNGTEWEVIDEREVLHCLLVLLCMLACFVWIDRSIDRSVTTTYLPTSSFLYLFILSFLLFDSIDG